MKDIARRTVRACCIERNTARINHHKGFFPNPWRFRLCMLLQRSAHLNSFSAIAMTQNGAERISLTVENLAAKEIHADEFSNIRGTRILQQVLLASLLNRTALIEYQDALSKKQGLQMLMCHHNSCDTRVGENLAQFLPHLAPCLHIQGR